MVKYRNCHYDSEARTQEMHEPLAWQRVQAAAADAFTGWATLPLGQ